MRLFIQRVSSLRAGWKPGSGELQAIAAICRALDGIPLAIELAAARAATLGLHEVLSHLNERFAVLVDGQRTAFPRHRTLRATLDWSYHLLPEREQSTLAHLAVFSGGFSLDAAAWVIPEAAAHVVAEDVVSLVNKSLVVLEETAGMARWRLLDTTRTYAAEKPSEFGRDQPARTRHASYFAAVFAASAVAGRSFMPGQRMKFFPWERRCATTLANLLNAKAEPL